MQKRFEIRQFRETDLDQVVDINRRCLPENYSRIFFLELYKRFPSLFQVAVMKRGVIGYALCRIELGFPDLGHIGFLTKKGHLVSIAVLKNHRRKGVGILLMKNVMKAMEEYNAKECFLEVRVSNRSAILMYEKLGFVDKKRLPGYYRDGEDAFMMTRSLPYEG
ncbi:MAG: ribosomal protein S18-alanine N-acetyltransferase [Candidatus Bathyarchaeota archaeon]|nr:MAG: ribosomal protein S18-alanine N-acetyltransferase [Candidatus Bathyarchaeota archaeon]